MDSQLRRLYQKTLLNPNIENKEKLWRAYSAAGLRGCSCENSQCQHCNNYGGIPCIEIADETTWIEMLGHFCVPCALMMPIEYHGDLELERKNSKICSCPKCTQIREFAYTYTKTFDESSRTPQERSISDDFRIAGVWVRFGKDQWVAATDNVIKVKILIPLADVTPLVDEYGLAGWESVLNNWAAARPEIEIWISNEPHWAGPDALTRKYVPAWFIIKVNALPTEALQYYLGIIHG